MNPSPSPLVSNPVPAWTPGIVLPAELITPEIAAAIKLCLQPSYVVALTAWAEARSRYVKGQGWVGNPIDALRDIMNVIDNRANDAHSRWGDHIGVCFAPRQFSCWSPAGGPQNYLTVLVQAQKILAGDHLDQKLFAALHDAAELLIGRAGWSPEFPSDTCHYYSDTMAVPPRWAEGHIPVAERLGHVFFAGIA